MNLLGKSLAVGAMALAASGAQATIQAGVTRLPTELVFNLWNPATEVSYALDLGILHNDFLNTKTQQRSWTIVANPNRANPLSSPGASHAFHDFLRATRPEHELFFNIASSNGDTTIRDRTRPFEAFRHWGVLRTSNDPNIAAVSTASVSNTLGVINVRGINLNTQQDIAGRDVRNNFDAFSTKDQFGYFENAWGDRMDGSTAFGTLGQEGAGNTLGFWWQNRVTPQIGLTGLERMPLHWTFVIDHASQTARLSYVPVPAAAWLFGTGLMGLVAAKRRKALVA